MVPQRVYSATCFSSPASFHTRNIDPGAMFWDQSAERTHHRPVRMICVAHDHTSQRHTDMLAFQRRGTGEMADRFRQPHREVHRGAVGLSLPSLR